MKNINNNIDSDMNYIVILNNDIYDFETLQSQIVALSKKYNFLNMSSIGESVMKKPIYKIGIGSSKNKVHINASHHANEWITSYIIMKHIEMICIKIDSNQMKLEDINYDFVPMVNPDGVDLCIHGIKSINNELEYQLKDKLLEMNEGSKDFSRWKANINGVDLNRNYDAGFNSYKSSADIKYPTYSHYPGEVYESEPETRAIVRLTNESNYDMVLAYHTQGEVIYWDYNGIMVPKAREYAIMFSEVSGYELDEPDELAASAGYKDWFIKKYNKPGFTIECGKGENPISVNQSEHIIDCTWPITVCLQIQL